MFILHPQGRLGSKLEQFHRFRSEEYVWVKHTLHHEKASRHVQYSSLVRVEKLNIQLVRV